MIIGLILLLIGLTHTHEEGPNLPAPIGKTTLNSYNYPAVWKGATSPGNYVVPATVASSTGASLLSLNQEPALKVAPSTVRKGHSSNSSDTKLITKLSVPRSTPVHITIPAIGVSAAVTKLGLNSNGSVQVPTSWYTTGWYKYGPTPGQIGSSVILGHVDSIYGPAVFDRIVDLKLGQHVNVELADHQTLTFSVIGIREYAKNDFPTETVYGARSYSALQLVTCGGEFDSQTHHYLSNIVVFTALTKE